MLGKKLVEIQQKIAGSTYIQWFSLGRLYTLYIFFQSLVPDAKPVPADELQLSVEEEEGQLMDDEDEDVVQLMAKEEEKQLELERLKEEKQKEKEKEEEERRKKRLERQERFEKKKQEEASANAIEKGEYRC